MDWHPLLLSARLALITVALVLPLLIIAARFISESRRFGVLLRALLTAPMVLPPTVLGFYLLLAFAPSGVLGSMAGNLGIRLTFSFPGILLASMVVAMPYMLHPILAGLRSIPPNLIEAARTLGKGKWNILWNVQIPNMMPSIFTACVLGFARIIGEFGVVLMVGGKIPGKTRLASMAVYDLVETMEYGAALQYSLVLTALSVGLLAVFLFLGEKRSLAL